RPDLEFKLNLWFIVLQVPGVCLGGWLSGIAGVAWAVLALQLADLVLVYVFLMRPLIGPCLREYVGCLVLPLATSACMALIVLLVPWLVQQSLVLVLAIQIVIGAIFYVVATVVVQQAKLKPFLDGLLTTRP